MGEYFTADDFVDATSGNDGVGGASERSPTPTEPIEQLDEFADELTNRYDPVDPTFHYMSSKHATSLLRRKMSTVSEGAKADMMEDFGLIEQTPEMDDAVERAIDGVLEMSGKVMTHTVMYGVVRGANFTDVDKYLTLPDKRDEDPSLLKISIDENGREHILSMDDDAEKICFVDLDESVMRSETVGEWEGDLERKYAVTAWVADMVAKAVALPYEVGADVHDWMGLWAQSVDPSNRVHSCSTTPSV